MSPQRIQRKRAKGWRMPEGAVYVGRPSRWGNPYGIERLSAHEYVGLNPDGSESVDGWGDRNFAAEWAVRQYRTALLWDFSTFADYREDYLRRLRGRDLACWCPLYDGHGNRVPCHADVLLELANPGWTP